MIFSSVFAERTRGVTGTANGGQERTLIILGFIVTCAVVAAVESILRVGMSAVAIDIVLTGYSAQGASVGDDRARDAVVASIAAGRVGAPIHALRRLWICMLMKMMVGGGCGGRGTLRRTSGRRRMFFTRLKARSKRRARRCRSKRTSACTSAG